MNSNSKRLLLAVAVAALAGGAVMTASAQTSSGPNVTTSGNHHRHFRRPGSPLLSTVMRAVRQLNLPAADITQIKTIVTTARQTNKPGSGAGGQPLDIATLLTDTGMDTSYISTVGTNAEARATQQIQLIQKIYAYLNTVGEGPQLLAAIQQIQAQQQARRAQWQQNHPAPTSGG